MGPGPGQEVEHGPDHCASWPGSRNGKWSTPSSTTSLPSGSASAISCAPDTNASSEPVMTRVGAVTCASAAR